ncbi:MAG: MgtC/SapB family protein [Chitinophagaceae bacterium]|nr:MAG: MgtC/SapB family protein [Chitinophagaceae bacterium]
MLNWIQILEQLGMVLLVGGLIGAEREFRSKSAGFRTMILICLGSWVFTTISMSIGHSSDDRIASNIVTGIGFLGAGVIFKADNRINGITTAATIWATAALGMGIADGAYTVVLIATAAVLAVLWMLSPLETVIDRINQSHTYRIVSEYKEDLLKEYERMFDDCHLRYKRLKRTKRGDSIIGTWYAHGSEKNHNKFTKMLMHHPAVKEFEF